MLNPFRRPRKPLRRGAVLSKTAGRCWYCGERLTGHWDIEHQHPRCQDGSDHLDNLVPSCCRCNGLKGGRSVEEFRQFLVTHLWGNVLAQSESILGLLLIDDESMWQVNEHYLSILKLIKEGTVTFYGERHPDPSLERLWVKKTEAEPT